MRRVLRYDKYGRNGIIMIKIGKDKYQHFCVCLIAAVIHPMLAVGLALGKENGDSKAIGNKWDWYDILADGIGILIGSGIHVII